MYSVLIAHLCSPTLAGMASRTSWSSCWRKRSWKSLNEGWTGRRKTVRNCCHESILFWLRLGIQRTISSWLRECQNLSFFLRRIWGVKEVSRPSMFISIQDTRPDFEQKKSWRHKVPTVRIISTLLCWIGGLEFSTLRSLGVLVVGS